MTSALKLSGLFMYMKDDKRISETIAMLVSYEEIDTIYKVIDILTGEFKSVHPDEKLYPLLVSYMVSMEMDDVVNHFRK